MPESEEGKIHDEVRMMPAREAILGGVGLGIIVGIVSMSLLSTLTVSTDMLVAIATLALAFVTVLTVWKTDEARKSAENIAAKQNYSSKWTKEQETKPYCGVVFVKNTSSDTAEGVYIKNVGHGPALAVKWIFKDSKKVYEGKDGLRQLVANNNLGGWLECYLPTMLAPSSTESIFRLVPEEKNAIGITAPGWESARDELRELLDTLTVTVSFTSIMWKDHRESLTFDSDNAW
jgi:hypothetical protein